MMVKIRMVAEVEIDVSPGQDPELLARGRMDAFREVAMPNVAWGITFYEDPLKEESCARAMSDIAEVMADHGLLSSGEIVGCVREILEKRGVPIGEGPE